MIENGAPAKQFGGIKRPLRVRHGDLNRPAAFGIARQFIAEKPHRFKHSGRKTMFRIGFAVFDEFLYIAQIADRLDPGRHVLRDQPLTAEDAGDNHRSEIGPNGQRAIVPQLDAGANPGEKHIEQHARGIVKRLFERERRQSQGMLLTLDHQRRLVHRLEAQRPFVAIIHLGAVLRVNGFFDMLQQSVKLFHFRFLPSYMRLWLRQSHPLLRAARLRG